MPRRNFQYKNALSQNRKKRKLINPFSKLKDNERLQKLIGTLFLFIITPYLLIAFTSYLFTWHIDMSKVTGSWMELLLNSDQTVENWLGKLGAIISHQFIYNWFGITSFLFILVFFIIGFKTLFKISLLPVKRTLKFSFFALIWLSVTLGYLFQNSEDLYHLMGGSFGYHVNRWLESLLGNVGLGIFIAFIFLCFLIIVFNISFDWFKRKTPDVDKAETDIETGSTISLSLEDDQSPSITEAVTDEEVEKDEAIDDLPF